MGRGGRLMYRQEGKSLPAGYIIVRSCPCSFRQWTRKRIYAEELPQLLRRGPFFTGLEPHTHHMECIYLRTQQQQHNTSYVVLNLVGEMANHRTAPHRIAAAQDKRTGLA